MSSASDVPPAQNTPVLTPLDLHERRILGVLVEKAKTTPETYPLSINALVTGCNQKSNRDPLLDLSDFDVEEALARAQKKGLTIRITGGRVIRWRHALYEAWQADKVELAILAELLLRGPQTEGELRSRASRMEPIDDLDALRNILRRMMERRLVVYLTAEDRRGSVLTHGFHEPAELERLRARHRDRPVEEPAVSRPPTTPAPQPRPDLENRLKVVENELASLRSLVAELQTTAAGLAEQLRTVKEGLGM